MDLMTYLEQVLTEVKTELKKEKQTISDDKPLVVPYMAWTPADKKLFAEPKEGWYMFQIGDTNLVYNRQSGQITLRDNKGEIVFEKK